MSRQSADAQRRVLALIPSSVPVGTWTVVPTDTTVDAATDLENRIAYLPTAGLALDRLVTLHEESHVRWDLPLDQLRSNFPAIDLPNVFPLYRMLREWVVDMRLAGMGAEYDIRPTASLLDWSQMPDPQSLDPIARVRQFVQWAFRAEHPAVPADLVLYVKELWSGIDQPVRDLVTEAYQAIRADLYNDQISEDYALRLAVILTPPPPPPQSLPQPKESAQTKQARQKAAQDAQERERIAQDQKQAGQQPAQHADPSSAQEQEQGSRHDAMTDDGQDATGPQPDDKHATKQEKEVAARVRAAAPDGYRTIKIHRHLDSRKPGKRVKNPIGLRSHGAVPTKTEYLRMGGQIFQEAAKPSGCILLDASSSMHWTEQQILAAIATAPNVTVAAYATGQLWGGLANQRYLCILAEKGRTSRTVPCTARGNNLGSDIPALLWLTKQTGPRIVVSDGQFYGAEVNLYPNGGSSHDLARDQYQRVCNAIMKRGRIVRVSTMAEAITLLEGKKPVRVYRSCSRDSAVTLRKGQI